MTGPVPHGAPEDALRHGQVLACLDRVNDPELDEPVTTLGFISGLTIQGDGVDIGFRLPTYWCAANFAFLMADDMRVEVGRLPWVRSVRVVLGDHMYADTINTAMAEGQGFQEAFGAEADGSLDAVRRIFDLKSFQRRQMLVLDEMLAAGHAPDALMEMTIEALPDTPLVARYLRRRGIPAPASPGALAFVDEAGQAVMDFPAHRRALRRVAVTVEFNGALCRGLLAARFNEPTDEPTLLDFVQGRVPARSDAPTCA